MGSEQDLREQGTDVVRGTLRILGGEPHPILEEGKTSQQVPANLIQGKYLLVSSRTLSN